MLVRNGCDNLEWSGIESIERCGEERRMSGKGECERMGKSLRKLTYRKLENKNENEGEKGSKGKHVPPKRLDVSDPVLATREVLGLAEPDLEHAEQALGLFQVSFFCVWTSVLLLLEKEGKEGLVHHMHAMRGNGEMKISEAVVKDGKRNLTKKRTYHARSAARIA